MHTFMSFLFYFVCTACELENCMRCDRVDDEETCTKCEGSGFSLSGGECTGKTIPFNYELFTIVLKV